MFLEKLNPTNNLWFLPKIKSCQGDMLLSKLKEVSARTNLEFPYGRTMLHPYLVKVGLQDQKADNHKFIMKISILVAWRYKYLIKVQKYREDGCLIVYLDSS